MTDTRGHGSKLGRKQEAVILALLETNTIAEAAQQTGLSESTIQRWMQLPQFRKAYRQAKRDMVEGATKKLLRTMGAAAIKLEKIMNDPSTPVGWQVSAATRILDRGRWAHENDDLAERIEALEEEQRQRGNEG